MSPRSTTRPLHFWKCGFQLRILEMTDVHRRRKCTVLPSVLASAITSFFVSDFRQLPGRYHFKFFPFFIRCCFCFWCFHIEHRNKFVHKNVTVQWIDSFPCNVIFMIIVVESLPCTFVDSSASTIHAYLCLANARGATDLPALSSSGLARHCCWYRNFQLSPRIVNSLLEFPICWINEVNTSQFSCIVKHRLFDSTLLLLFSFRRLWHVFPCLWPQGVWPGCR